MFTAEEIMQLVQSLIWLLAGVGVFIVGMGFMSEALEKSAGEGMKRLAGLERVADHLVNVGYSIVSPIGSDKEE